MSRRSSMTPESRSNFAASGPLTDWIVRRDAQIRRVDAVDLGRQLLPGQRSAFCPSGQNSGQIMVTGRGRLAGSVVLDAGIGHRRACPSVGRPMTAPPKATKLRSR
jgi:hypothetical protein